MIKRKNKAAPEVEDIETKAAEEIEEQIEEEVKAEEIAEETPEVNPLEEELKNQKENYLRLAAEYDNFRKRSQREKAALAEDIKADCIAELLPVIDNLERALAAENTDVESFRQGVEMVMTQTMNIFEKLSVSAYGEPGDDFDPNFHHAVSAADSEEFESGQIIMVLQKGYKIGERVIRPAMVQTAN